MKKNTKIRLTLAAALAGLAISGAAIAGPGGHGRGHHRGHHGGFAGKFVKMMERLDLTEQQEVQAVRLRRQLRADHKAMRPQMKAARKAAMAELAKDAPDAAALRAAVDRMTELRRQQAQRAIDAMLTLHATLSPDQKAKLRAHLQRVDKRMDKRAERRRGAE